VTPPKDFLHKKEKPALRNLPHRTRRSGLKDKKGAAGSLSVPEGLVKACRSPGEIPWEPHKYGPISILNYLGTINTTPKVWEGNGP